MGRTQKVARMAGAMGSGPHTSHPPAHPCRGHTQRPRGCEVPSCVCRNSFVFGGGKEPWAAVRRQAPPPSSALNLLCDPQQAAGPLWCVSFLKCQTGTGLSQVTPSHRNMSDSRSGAASCPLPWVRPPGSPEELATETGTGKSSHNLLFPALPALSPPGWWSHSQGGPSYSTTFKPFSRTSALLGGLPPPHSESAKTLLHLPRPGPSRGAQHTAGPPQGFAR